MFTDNKIWMAQSEDKNLYLLPKMANRHGIIAGATGTGKTVTMKVMAESFSDMGVPVFLCDVKGDLSGMCVRRKACRRGSTASALKTLLLNLIPPVSGIFSVNRVTRSESRFPRWVRRFLAVSSV